MAQVLDALLKAREDAEAVMGSYMAAAEQANANLNTILGAELQARGVLGGMDAWQAGYDSFSKLVAEAAATPILIPSVPENVYGVLSARLLPQLPSYNPVLDMVREFQESWGQTLRNLESSLRFDALAELTEAELMELATRLAAEDEQQSELQVTAAASEQQAGKLDDPVRKIALLSIFVCLLVLAGKITADEGWALVNLLTALIPLFTLYAGRD